MKCSSIHRSSIVSFANVIPSRFAGIPIDIRFFFGVHSMIGNTIRCRIMPPSSCGIAQPRQHLWTPIAFVVVPFEKFFPIAPIPNRNSDPGEPQPFRVLHYGCPLIFWIAGKHCRVHDQASILRFRVRLAIFPTWNKVARRFIANPTVWTIVICARFFNDLFNSWARTFNDFWNDLFND